MKINSFNPVASRYSEKVAPRRFSQFLTLVHELELRGDEEVLDIGSGPGELSIQIASRLEAGGFLHGIDLSEAMIELARKVAEEQGHSNVMFGAGDALDLKFRDGSFDVVVSSNAFPWVADRQQFLREVRRVLKPNGRFALVALSSKCYREFASAFTRVSKSNPGMFPEGRPFSIMGAKLHNVTELGKVVSRAGFNVSKRFVLATEEPITAQEYLERVNSIVNENYLDHLRDASERKRARKMIIDALESYNGELRVTESSIFVIAEKLEPVSDYSI
jgi:ubiquinone/menaquinone biosynthesis C-methylase UbiE